MIRTRFQTQEIYGEQGGVTTYRGVDPLTGLPVLVYVFPGRPTLGVGTFESENVPGILATHVDDDGGHVVAAYSPHYGLVAPGEAVVDDRFALDALRAVRDAARAGVVHGDLRPGRLLYADGHVLVEGYGVPWRPADDSVRPPEATDASGPDLRGDVYAIAATLLLLGRDNLSGGVSAALRTAVQAGSADRPTASALYNEVRRLSGGVVTPPPQRFEELTLPVADGGPTPPPREDDRSLSATRADFRLDLDLDLDLQLPDEADVPGDEGARPAPDAPAVGGFRPPPPAAPPPMDATEGDEPEPITLHSDPGLAAPPRGTRRARDSDGGFVKDLPPGATYRAGQLDGAPPAAPVRLTHERAPQRRRRSWRGPLLVALVVVLAGAAASLAFLNRGGVTPGGAGGAVSFIVDVSVAPADLPPVDLVVVQSPDGSGSPPGTILTSVPRKVVFDRAGTWVVQGVFQGRRSRPTTVTLPGDRSTTIRFDPLPPSGTQR